MSTFLPCLIRVRLARTKNSQRNRGSFFSLALLALAAAKFQSRFPIGMNDRPNSLCARLRNDNVANFQILIENQVDGIVFGGGF